MASPQTENGYTKIANELFDQLVKTALLGAEQRIVYFIIRKTYGFNKKKDRIPLSQFEKGTGLSRPTVNTSLKNLVRKNVLVKTALLEYSVQKDWEKWTVNTALLVKHNDPTSKDRLTKIGKDRLTLKRKKETSKEIIQQAQLAEPINQVINIFYETINPNINYANKSNREATEWLIGKHGLEKVMNATRYAISVQKDKYAPTINTPTQLKDKMASLVKYKNSQDQPQGRTRKIWK